MSPPSDPPETRDRRAATVNDVARSAGVSQATVSRVFTQGASVSPKTRGKVLDAARAVGYRPNLIARSLITRRSNIIGVAIAYMDNQFYPQILQALSQDLSRRGFRVLLFTPGPDGDCDLFLEEMLQFRVDALVLASAELSSHFAEECRQNGLPVVLLNRKTEASSVSSVTADNITGGRAIAAFLAAGGHRRCAFMAGLESSSTSRDREAGFTGRLRELGLPAPLRARGFYDFERARAAARELLAAPERPDAIFCANDHMALAAIETARSEFGLAPGRDISIIGFDDVGAAAWPSFDLTTYVQSIPTMVRAVVAIIEEQLAAIERSPVQAVVPGELVVRGSARRPPSGVVESGGRAVWRED